MFCVTRRFSSQPVVAATALMAGLALFPAIAMAGPRDGHRESSRGSSSSSSSGSSSASSASAPTSSSVRDTRPSGTPGGRVDADARDGRSSSRRGHFGSRGRFGHGGYWNDYYYGGYYPWGWFGYWGSPYYYWGDTYYRGGYGRTVVYPNDRYGATGALDLDVSPERAEIYIDGELLGSADDYDGFPELLWLQKGTYDLVIYMPGFRTIARQISIVPGLVIDVDDRMERGESVRPEDLMTRTHERRDARIRADREREAEVDARSRAGDWRARPGRSVEPRRGDGRYEDADDADDADADDDEDDDSMRGDTAALRLEVDPGDASVYLDGRFVGTGADLSRLPAGIVVEPGDHEVEVVRPGHRARSERFSARAGATVELEIDLDTE